MHRDHTALGEMHDRIPHQRAIREQPDVAGGGCSGQSLLQRVLELRLVEQMVAQRTVLEALPQVVGF